MTEEVKENKWKEKALAALKKMKPLLALNPILTSRFGDKLKPYIKPVYYVLSVVLAIMGLDAIWDLFAVGFLTFVLEALLAAVGFVIVRMFAEYVANN